jgi:ClpP class serine protease
MIAVSVDSLNGSIVQAEIISSALIHKAKELKCPLYTFAEATSLGPGYIILSSGTKLHADPHSLIGGISASFQQLGLSKALKDLKIKANLLSTAQTRLNPFEELKKQDEDWIVKILSNYDAVIKEIINNNRKQVSVFNI